MEQFPPFRRINAFFTDFFILMMLCAELNLGGYFPQFSSLRCILFEPFVK